MKRVIRLLNTLSNELEKSSKDRVSTDELTSERLLWEIFNKVFTIIVSCENALRTKDSLAVHLVARYTYELLIISAYIFIDESKCQERVKAFLGFSQFNTEKRSWDEKVISEMVKEIPNDQRFSAHKRHYRALSNYAHPTMDSFLLNRRGNQAEFALSINTVLLTTATIIEIVNICFEKKLYFHGGDNEHKIYKDIAVETHRLMVQG